MTEPLFEAATRPSTQVQALNLNSFNNQASLVPQEKSAVCKLGVHYPSSLVLLEGDAHVTAYIPREYPKKNDVFTARESVIGECGAASAFLGSAWDYVLGKDLRGFVMPLAEIPQS